jgi:hypothetical protein
MADRTERRLSQFNEGAKSRRSVGSLEKKGLRNLLVGEGVIMEQYLRVLVNQSRQKGLG